MSAEIFIPDARSIGHVMTQTPAFYFDIIEILSVGRCPVCELLRRKSMNYIDHALYGLVVDPQTQNRFAESGGYCRRHGEMLFKIPWGSALGVAILHRRLIEDAADTLKSAAAKPGAGRTAKLEKAIDPDCLACKVEQEALEGVLQTVLATLKEKDGRMTEAVGQGRGFCLHHLNALLGSARDADTISTLRRHGLRTAEHLLAELSEFIRKSDYRFTKEQMGKEGDSWMRAVAWMTGLPLEKEDRGYRPGALKKQLRGDEPPPA
jgi:hypothetical protein